MKTTKLLNNILAMLRSVKEDRTKLLKLYELMVNEIYEEVKEEEPDIPEKYRNVTREAAEWVDAGMVCYINPITLELVCIPTHVLDEIEWEEEDDLDDYAPFREDLRRVNTEWDKFVTVEPPDSNEAFRFMERFTHAITGERMYQILTNALQRPKPFKNFNAIVHQSPVREAWFAFKQKCLEEYVFNELLQSLQENSL